MKTLKFFNRKQALSIEAENEVLYVLVTLHQVCIVANRHKISIRVVAGVSLRNHVIDRKIVLRNLPAKVKAAMLLTLKNDFT